MTKEHYKNGLTKMFEGTKAERLFLAEQSFGLFCLYYFSHYFKYELADYHYQIFEDIEDLIDCKIRELVLIIYREGGKTTLEKLAYIWILAYKKRMYPNADAFEKENSERILFDIAFELVNNKRFQADFGVLFSKEKSVNEIKQNRINNFITQNGVRLEAHSTQESMRGRLHLAQRPDFLSLDDFETNKTKDSQAYTKQVRDHITEAMAGLSPNGVILYCCNYLSEYGNVQWLIDRAKTDPKIRVRNIPVVINEKPAWEGKYALTDEEAEATGKVSIEDKQRQLGSLVFSYEMMNQPIDESMAEFKKQHIHSITEEEVLQKETLCYITIDSAVSKKDEADFTGVTINRVDINNKWYIHAYRLKINSKELIDHLFYLNKTYSPKVIGLEKTTFTLAIQPFLEEEMRKQQVFFSVTPLEHKLQNKEARIRGLIPRWESNSIFLVGTNTDLIDEMRTFPRGQHDDCIAEDTLILTKRGNVKIQDITTEDYVMTRGGFQRVLKVWDKGILPVITNIITGTPEHRVITEEGEKHLCQLDESDILYKWNNQTKSIEKQSYMEVKNSIDTQTQKDDNIKFITGNTTQKEVQHHYIGKYGLITLVQYLKGFIYIIKTKIHLIMNSQILSVYQHQNTLNTTQINQQEDYGRVTMQRKTTKCFKLLQKNGDIVKKVKNGTKNILKKVLINLKLLGVKFVKKSELDMQVIVNTVQKDVVIHLHQDNLDSKILTTIKEKRVYDLMVENHHEFFADGVLVHNCLDSFAYQLQHASPPFYRPIFDIEKEETNEAI